MMPERFWTRAPAPDKTQILEAIDICQQLLKYLPNDPVLLCTLGYLHLEQHNEKAAEPLFLKAIQHQSHFVEARNGHALAIMGQHLRKAEALYRLRETTAMDPAYAAARYNLSLCHLTMDGNDLLHQFEKVIQTFPDHPQAHFKLGVLYEEMHATSKAIAAYSRQIMANPTHIAARERLAWASKKMPDIRHLKYSVSQLDVLAQKHPKRFLPLLAEAQIENRDFAAAEKTYGQFLNLVGQKERMYYEDMSLIAAQEDMDLLERAPVHERGRMRRRFWLLQDPTPTTKVNERRVEHYRRVHYARQHFSQGMQPYDRRGEVYIRFGQPDHQSWSNHLIFESDAKVTEIKNRLNEHIRQNATEVTPSQSPFGLILNAEAADVRGLPAFPLSHGRDGFGNTAFPNVNWESWIYTDIGTGMEITFTELGGIYDYAMPPAETKNWQLWQRLSPERVVAQVISQTPSVYAFDYGGEALDFHIYAANFQALEETDLTVFLGVPHNALEWIRHGEEDEAVIDREMVLYNADWEAVYRDSSQLRVEREGEALDIDRAWLLDKSEVNLPSGEYFCAVQVRDPNSRRLQILKERVSVDPFPDREIALSDLVLANHITITETPDRGFRNSSFDVVPNPARYFKKDQPVHLYYEIYNLTRDTFGQTRYRVDYALSGKGWQSATQNFIRSIGHLLGFAVEREGVHISYEHKGRTTVEPIAIALDVPSASQGEVTLEVTVTDLHAKVPAHISRRVNFQIGE